MTTFPPSRDNSPLEAIAGLDSVRITTSVDISVSPSATQIGQAQEIWQPLADVPFVYGVSSGGGLATDGTYLYAADFSGDGDDDYIDLNGDLVDDGEERLDNLGMANGSVRFARYNPETDTWDSLPTLNAAGVSGDAFSAGNLVNPLFVAGNKLYYYQFRSGPQIAALYSYDLTAGTESTWIQEWEKYGEDSTLIDSNAGIVGLDVQGKPAILHHTGGGDYNFARTDDIENGGIHTRLTPNWYFNGLHFPRNGDWDYDANKDRLYHLSGDQLVMWTHDDSAYPGGSFVISAPDGVSPLAVQNTLLYSLKNDLGWTNSGTGTSLWGNSVTSVGNALYLLRGETSSDNWPFNEGRGLINNADFARVIVNQTYDGYYYISERTSLPDAPFSVGKGSSAVYLHGYLYVTQGDTLTVADDAGNLQPLAQEGIRLPGKGLARFAINTADDNYEENDSLTAAYDLTERKGILLSTIDGQGISYAGDEDWYNINVDANEQYFSAFVTFPINSRYIDLELYNTDGSLVASAAYRSASGEFRREINTILSGGEYYLRLNSPFSYSGQPSNTYDLFWSTQSIDAVADEFENNDTMETATDIRNLEGNLFTDLLLVDEDWYQIDATAGESWLRLAREGGESENPVTFNLYDAQGSLIASNPFAHSPYYQEFNTALPSEGVYYLQWIPSGDGNTYSFSWETFILPNLAVTEATISSATPDTGETVSVSWKVENNGAGDTWQGWYDAVFLSEDTNLDVNDIWLGSPYRYDLISAGTSYSQTLDVTIPEYVGEGTRYLLFSTDYYGYQPESDETDNVYSLPIAIAGYGINLVITDVTAPSTTTAGQSIDLSWTVENNGSGTTGSFYWYDRVVLSQNQIFGDSDDVYLTGEYIYSFYGLPLEANETYTVNTTLTLPSQAVGSGYLLFKTDSDNYQGETDENDNVYVHAIDIAAPNLIITGVTAPSTTTAGQSINLSWTVENNGSVTTGSSYWYDRAVFSKNQTFGDSDDVYLTEEFIYTSYGLPLEANETYTVNRTLTLPGQATGSGYLLFKTDSDNYQGETDENDNVYVHAIDIAAPNLIITGVTAPSTTTAGQSINLSWTVENNGSVTTGSSYWYDRAVFSKNQTFGDSDDVYLTEGFIYSSYGLPLEANETYTVNTTLTLPGQATGSGYLLFKTDSDNYQGETDENDNVYVHAIDIAAPNLTISTASAPTNAILGQSLAVSWTVANTGSVPANADWYDSVYLSNDTTLDSSDQQLSSFWQGGRTPLAAGGSYTDSQNITISSYLGTGDRYLIFATDYYSYYYYNNLQGETDETDNTYVLPISLSAPDLIVTEATAPSSGATSSPINVSWTVKNQGDVAALTDWYDTVYLSSDNILGNFNDIYVTDQYISSQTPLASDGTYTISRTVTLPNVTSGDYYLFVRTDAYSYQGETDETNNYSLGIPITIGVPDLIIATATAPESGALGGSIQVSWTVENQGDVEAGADWTDYIYWSRDNTYDFSDTFITSISAASQTPVLAGGNYSKTQNIILPNQLSVVGDGYLIVLADGNNVQGETNENNNTYAVPISINAPDLIVFNATTPASVNVGATINISWDVTNQGTVAANADWYDRVVISTDQVFGNADDTYLTEVWQGSFTPLAAGATYSRTLNVTLPTTATGDRYLLFKADQYNQQGETDENNNVYSLAINISAADLQVTAVNAPTAAVLGESVELTWTVTNQGTGVATRDWYDLVYLSGNQTLDGADVQVTSEYIATQTPLEAGASYTISKNVVLPSFATGNQYLLFVADSYNYQGESNENNNVRSVAINLGAPDLIVSAAAAPTNATVGKSVEVSWTVQNQGTIAAPADWYDRFYLSNDAVFDANADTYITQELISTQTPLAAGASYSITRNINLPNFATGSRYLIFVADGSGGQGETNENNNTRAVAINLNAPDLVVSDITAPVETLSGQPIDLSWTVTNQGNASAEGTWYDYVYLVNTATSATQYVGIFEYSGSLAAGASLTRTQSYSVPLSLTGNYRVVVTADYYGYIAEGTQNESNNTATDDRPISIQLSPVPNLQVTGVNAPPTAFSSQETVVQWTVKNVGTGATNAPVWYDRVYLSLDTTYDNTDTYLGEAVNPSYLNPNDSYSNSLNVTLPRGIDGNYYFLIQADIYNHVTEVGNEGDNWGSGGPTDVNLTPPPDLQVTAVNAPNGAFSGQPMNLSWTVTNAGTGRTLETAWYDRVFMSADATLDAGDRFLGDFYHSGSLNAGANYTGSATVNLPIGVAGSFFFFVQSDIYNNVYEHVFENNNTGYDSTATNITLTPPPDLEFESLTIPNNARSGGNLSIDYRVTNFGATETPNSSWTDTFYLSSDNQLNTATDINLGSVSRYGILNPDDGYDRIANFTLPNTLTGTYYVFGVTDSSDVVFELNNANNTVQSSNQVQIVSQPADLVVTDGIIPTNGEAGKTVQVQWTVKNQGAGDTIVSSWSDRIVASSDDILGDADDITLANFTRTGLLAPNGTYSRTESVILPFTLEGNYQLFVVTDSANSVYESSNEGNNGSSAFPITISRNTPDLQVTSITLPGSLTPGQPLLLNWTVANSGAGRTNSNYWYDQVYLSLDKNVSGNDINLGSVYRSGALDPSASYSATGTFSLPITLSGSYYVLVQTDWYNNVIEGAFENNNVLASDSSSGGGSGTGTLPITPAPSADLAVASVDAPEQGIAGQSLSLTWTVVNNDANTGQSWYDTVYLSRDQVFDRSNDIYLGYRSHTGGLNGGDSYTATQSFNVPRGLGGRYYAFVVADGGNAVYERLGEVNNVNYDGFSTEIIIPPPSDLVVTNITVPTSGIPGQGINITYTVQNQGTDTSYGSWTDSVYLSRDTQWDIGDALVGQVNHSGDVAGGASYTGTLNNIIPGVNLGNYHVIVRSDIRNQVPEVNENNNTGVSGSQITLDVEALTLGAPDTGNLGQGQYVYYRVDVEAGETLKLALDGQSDNALNELYVRYGEMPTRGQFDFTVSEPFVSDPNVIIPSTQAGTYYIMAYGDSVPTNQTNYSIQAEILPFGISHLSTNQGGNSGQVTLQLQGAKFDELTKVELIDGNTIIQPIWYDIIDPTRMTVTFDLKGKPVGQYDLHAFAEQTFLDVSENTGEVIPETIRYDDVTLTDQFTIVEGGGAAAAAQLLMPSAARFGNLFSFYVEIANEGTNDLPVPVYRVASPNGTPLGTTANVQANDSSQLQIMAVGELRSTVLAPGERVLIPLFAKATQEPSSRITLENLTRPGELIDWDALEGIYRDQSSDTQWTATWGNFQGIVGDSWDSFHEAMRQAVDDLPRSQDTRFVPGELLIQDLLSRARLGQNDSSGFIEEYNGEGEQAYYASIEQAVEDYNNSLENMSPPVPEMQVNSVSLSEASSLDCSELEKPITEVGKDRYAELLCNCPASTAQLLADEAWVQFFVNTAIRAKFGGEVARIWNKYLNGTPSSPPSKETFNNNDDIGKAFETSKTTQTVTRALLDEAKLQLLSKLNSGEIDCKNIPTTKDIKQLLSADKITFYQNKLNYNVIGEIPGNIAGGIGAISSRQDTRKIEGNILISVQKDDCDKVTSIELKTDLKITVEDGLDFCPGDLGSAEKLYGLISEQDVTIPMARLEGNGWAYDVPIDVIYSPEVQTLSISASELPEGCEPDQTPPLPPDPCNPTPPDECDDNNTPPSPPPDCDDNDDEEETPTVRPRDPNDIIGPNGFGDEKWISASDPFAYTIRFENQSTATAPAQQVTITHPLDADVDFRTFRVGSFGWGGFISNVPNNRSFYNQRLDLTADYGFYVDVLANIDVTSGVASWTLTTIDPETGEIPENPLLGFLPPNNEDGVGDGFVTYTIRTGRNAETGDVIDAEATIIFDTEEPISTPPIFNTLDVDKPSSEVNELPETTATPEFLVSWTGADVGSALATYTIYVSENGGEYTIWLDDTELTEATYTGTAGRTYAFYSVAADNAGNTEAAPTTPDATITLGGVVDQPPVVSSPITDVTVDEDAANTVIDLTNVFSDADGDVIVKSILTNTNTGLVTATLVDNELTLDYLPNQFGTAQITVRGTANGQFVDDTFTINVGAVDDAPIVSNPITDVSVNEDAADTVIDLTNVFSDVDGDVIVKSILTNTNTGLVTATLVDNELTLDYLPNQSGTAQITVRGTANGQFVDDIFTINVGAVDDAPVVSNPITDVTVDEDASDTVIDLTNVFSDIDGDVIVKTILTNTNTGLVTATLVDNQLTLDYLPNQFGTAQITVRGTANGQTVDDTFNLTVNAVDDAPVVSNPIADVTVNEDASDTVINLATVFSDADGDVVVKSIVTNSNNTLVTTSLQNNTLTLDYLPNQFGTAQITVRGTANGQSVEDTFTLTVNGVNDAPTVNKPIDTQILTTNNAFSFTIPSDTFSDVDTGDTLSYTINNDSTFTLTNLTITGTPTQTGTKTLTLVATDSQGLTAQTPIQLSIFNPVTGATNGDNTLTGTDGDDLIDARDGRDNVIGGRGNDRIVGGSGADVLGGGEGRDTFVYTSIRDSGDRLTDFDVNQDYLDFSALLDSLNYTGSNPVTDGYVSWRTLGTGTLISVDSDGTAGRGVARPFITLEGVISSALTSNNFVF